jgi:membrane protein implicated in regulation of membrane protease activity
MNTNIFIWIIILVVSVLAEVFSMQLVSIWFAIASLVALITSMFLPPLGQFAVFVVVSLLLLIITRPVLKKFKVKKSQPTNYDLDIGKIAIVIETIDESLQSGRVSLNGVDWNAKSIDGSVIEVDSKVVVEYVQGSKLLVRRA